MSKLTTKIGQLKLKNPVILASGTFTRSICSKIDVEALGAIVTKTITLKERLGNPLPHIAKTKYGWMNSVGLKNPGLTKYLAEELPFWQTFDTVIVPSIGGETIDEYVELAKNFEGKVKAIEVNVSCPNVSHGGMAFGVDPKNVEKLTKKIRKIFSGTLLVKLSPNVTDITVIAGAALSGGADILTVANTVLGLEIDHGKEKAVFARVTAGYSGPAIKPIALKNVWQVWQKFHCPIFASGGIENGNDAIDFLLAGAAAIQIGSANFTEPQTSIHIAKEIGQYVSDHKLKNIDQIKGKLKVA